MKGKVNLGNPVFSQTLRKMLMIYVDFEFTIKTHCKRKCAYFPKPQGNVNRISWFWIWIVWTIAFIVGWKSDKANIQTKSFIPTNVCDSEKYIPTTKYVTMTQPQKIQEKYFWALIF